MRGGGGLQGESGGEIVGGGDKREVYRKRQLGEGMRGVYRKR